MKKTICATLCFMLSILFLVVAAGAGFVESLRSNKGSEQAIWAHGKSMGETIPPESVVILDTEATPKVGDIVCFEYYNDKIILHRVIDMQGDQMTTKGDGNKNAEKKTTPIKNVVGVYKTHYPYLGYLWRKNPVVFLMPAIAFALIAIVLVIARLKQRSRSLQHASSRCATTTRTGLL